MTKFRPDKSAVSFTVNTNTLHCSGLSSLAKTHLKEVTHPIHPFIHTSTYAMYIQELWEILWQDWNN